jgi:hypothetical protein
MEKTALVTFPKQEKEIVKLHDETKGIVADWLTKAIRIGELLTDVKETLEHGQWLPWVEAKAPFNNSMASRYMRIYDKREQIRTSGANLTLEDVKKLTATNRKPRKADPVDTGQGGNKQSNKAELSTTIEYVESFEKKCERNLKAWIDSVPSHLRNAILFMVFEDFIYEYSNQRLRLHSTASLTTGSGEVKSDVG